MAKAKIYYAQVDLPLHLRPTPSSPLRDRYAANLKRELPRIPFARPMKS